MRLGLSVVAVPEVGSQALIPVDGSPHHFKGKSEGLEWFLGQLPYLPAVGCLSKRCAWLAGGKARFCCFPY